MRPSIQPKSICDKLSQIHKKEHRKRKSLNKRSAHPEFAHTHTPRKITTPPHSPRLENFWNAVADLKWVIDHPLSQRVDFRSKTVPLRLFGDGIAVLGVGKSWGRSVDAFTVQPLLSEMTAKYSTILLSLVWKGRRHPNLMPRLWEILVWSFQALAKGKWPSHDWRGREYEETSEDGIRANSFLAGGYSAVVVVRSLVSYKPGFPRFWHIFWDMEHLCSRRGKGRNGHWTNNATWALVR